MARDIKMLQLVLDKVSVLDRKVDKGFKNVDIRFDKTDKRIDKIGLQVARLEDDAPTIEEFDNLEERVTKLEHPHFAAKQFNAGAEAVAELAILNGCEEAVLKARSPSCGVGKCIGIEKLRGGDCQNRDGVTAERLRTLGLKLRTEEEP